MQEKREKFAELMTAMEELYKQKSSGFLFEIYFSALKKYDIETLTNAIGAHVSNTKNGQFMPRPADIIRQIEKDNIPAEHRAMVGWSEVERQIRSVGSYDTPNFKDPLISHVIYDMGGWVSICQVMEKDLVWMGKDFERRYLSYAERPPANGEKRLTGTFADHNGKISDGVVLKKLFSYVESNGEEIQDLLEIGHDHSKSMVNIKN
jgi:hypothetical protein